MPLQGFVYFPGIVNVRRASYTLSHGITPGVATLEITPQPGLPSLVGDLAWEFAGTSFVLRGMKVDKATVQRDPSSGEVWSFSLLDRRWKWQFGIIQRAANLRRPDGSIDADTEASPQQLAAECLAAMGEVGFDVSLLPNDARPLIQWEAEVPAQALAQLCEQLGCRVVLRLDGTVQLCPAGLGFELPDDYDLASTSLVVDPPERPDSIAVVCGKSRFQGDFIMRPVGVDIDGSVKPIDQLSYRPAAGWQFENPRIFAGVSNVKVGDVIPRDLAKETVYRWYQIVSESPSGNGPLMVPGCPFPILDVRQILPIEDTLVETAGDKPKPCQVFGAFWKGGTDYANTPAGTMYRGDFTVDRERGIVQFRDYVVLAVKMPDGSYIFQAANLGLRTAVSVRRPDTLAWVRTVYTRTYDGPLLGTGPRLIFRDEIVTNVWPVYLNNQPFSLLSNLNEVVAEADYYVQYANAEYQGTSPYEISYNGLKAISPDGAIQQVSWECGIGGAKTRAGRNNEFSRTSPDYRTRQAWVRLRSENLNRLISGMQAARAEKRP